MLIALATLGGAEAGRRSPRASAVPLAASCGALVAVVVADLGPDVAGDVRDTGIGWPAVVLVGAIGFVGAGVLMKRGCPCEPGLAGGVGTAAALGVHRALEGSALAVAASAPLVLALVVHASSEGFALTALLGADQPVDQPVDQPADQPADQPGARNLKPERRRTMLVWLTIACVAPAFGMLVVGSLGLPEKAHPLLTAAVAGVLARTALAAYRIAAERGQPLVARSATVLSAGMLASALALLTHMG
jgi:ZIP family zinc transporter